ncbi:hypothetical protein [Demequina sp. SO4-18]|uniref:hypothetical protein n=1 Tax=Demequina sp. SO4-18 TaxID=3401026 RepID=UPI003B5CC4EA
MSERISAYDATTGERTYVSRRWVDNPGIANGRYVSKLPTKTSRAKREPVDSPEVAESVTDHTDTPSPEGLNEETS